jgi:hypothetical protein
MNWLLAVFLKATVGFVLMLLVYVIARALHRVLPPGRIKTLLYSPLPGHRRPGRYPS